MEGKTYRSRLKIKEWYKFYNKRKKLYKEVQQAGREILLCDNFKKNKNYIQHGDMSIQYHCISVAICSLDIANKLHLQCERSEMIRGALLHDYFLYDWHDKNQVRLKDLHGFNHPQIALNNALLEFQLSVREQDIIKKHMWPLTFIPPLYRETWIVSLADKFCSIKETFYLSRGHVVYSSYKLREEI